MDFFFKGNDHEESAQIFTKFVQNLNKHFLPQVAIKVIWFMNYLATSCTNLPAGNEQLRIDFEKMSRLEYEPVVQGLWQENTEVAKIITESFQKWVESSRRG